MGTPTPLGLPQWLAGWGEFRLDSVTQRTRGRKHALDDVAVVARHDVQCVVDC